MARLVRDISNAIGSAYSDARVKFWFDNAWPDFERGYQTIRQRATDTAPPIHVPDRALLEEVLATVRPFRQFQESMGETLRSRVVSIEWYEPLSFDLGVAQATRIQKEAIGDFLKIQMRDPAKAERFLKAINDDPATEAYAQGKGGSSEHRVTFEDLTVTWDATYSRGLDAAVAYIKRIQHHDPG
jgi:hypothetical protein